MSHPCDDGEPCEVHKESTRVARKDTKCDACGETIRRGDQYSYTFFVWDGDPSTVRRCARCQKIHLHLRDLCSVDNKKNWDNRWPADELDCDEDYKESWGEEPPDDIAALAFALPGETKL